MSLELECDCRGRDVPDGTNPHMDWCGAYKVWAEQQRVAKLMAETRYEGHVDSLPYGWWQRHAGKGRVLPATIKDKRNYVLTLDELKQWHADLAIASEQLTEQRSRVLATIKALETGREARSWETHQPTCFTLAHALQYMVVTGKHKLATLQWMLAMMEKRRDTLVRVPNQQQGDANETSSGGA